jgi:hypothetical protein
MKQHVLLFVAAIAAAAGCGKPSDLRPMQEEANGFARSYEERVTALDRRAQDLLKRGEKLQLGPDSEPASDQLGDLLRVLIPGMQAALREAPARIDRIVKDEKLDEPKKLHELRSYTDQIQLRLTNDWIRANAKLDAVEAWLSRAEARPRVSRPEPAAPPPAAEPPPPGSDAAGGTLPAGDPRAAGDDAGNAAR